MRVSLPAADLAAATVVRRKCACGGSHAGGQCEACRERERLGLQPKLIVGPANDPLEREADAAADAATADRPVALGPAPQATLSRSAATGGGAVGAAPPSVARVVGGAGEPLARAERSYFEQRFGHDFAKVRIHRDAAAARSAREVAAHAYTVGHHVVFGAGTYRPGTRAGRLLLAHELAHVVQQSGAVRRASISSPLEGVADGEVDQERREDEEGPGEEAAGVVQRLPLGPVISDPIVLPFIAQFAECLANGPRDPDECDPDRPLTWADFTGTVPASSPHSAWTVAELQERPINATLARCLPQAAPGSIPRRGVQAAFAPGSSWVRPRFSNPADPALNGCNGIVADCERHFDAQPAGATGATWGVQARRGCAAAAQPRGTLAHSRDECATVVAQDCAQREAAESARLLAHEQGHFDLACAMAKKANAMLATAPDFDVLLRAARLTHRQQDQLYDRQTDHGCNAGPQAKWEADIAAGLPGVAIDLRLGQRRQRRRR